VVLYTLVLWGTSLVLVPVAGMGAVYSAAATVLGGVFTYHALRLTRDGTAEMAMRLFGWSITYIVLLFGAMAVDQLIAH
jgi:protoheme IX farnesyltransferase